MGMTRDLFKKTAGNKGIFHIRMGIIKNRIGMDPREAEEIKKRWQEYTELYKKGLHDTDVYNGLLDSEGEGEGGMIWENGILTCILSCKN